MQKPSSEPLLFKRLDIHDRKQFEIKLEYQPSKQESKTRYLIETFAFLPASLNVDAETYPRADFYADIHNYVRLKTPVLSLAQLLGIPQSPLVRLEQRLAAPPQPNGQPALTEADAVYDAKLLSCVFRGAMRRFVYSMDTRCTALVGDPDNSRELDALKASSAESLTAVSELLRRFRTLARVLGQRPLQEKTRAALRLVDEYLSLTVEQFFRKAVAGMDRLPRTSLYVDLRKQLTRAVVDEERYRRDHKLASVLSPTGDNEEYMQRMSFLKKYCMNILFLAVRREEGRSNWEEALFAIAAGLAMAFATLLAFFAQLRFPQVSFNFFLVLVVGYMMKDRIKEALRRVFSRMASRHLFDRTTNILDPVTKGRVGVCREKVDYGTSAPVPEEIRAVRRTDDFVTVADGEMAETVIRYQKEVVLRSDLLPRVSDGVTGVTDIIRLNVERLLRDMDDPEMALEYIDLEDLTVGKVKGAKRYQVDLAFRFTVGDGADRHVSLQLVRLVLDRNGIKRMQHFEPPKQPEGREGALAHSAA